MTAYNIVRFKVKEGLEQAFLDAHKNAKPFAGMIDGAMVKTGVRAYCVVFKWDTQASIVAARPQMIALLDSFRHTLEDLGPGLGVTDPVSGEVVLDFKFG